MSVLAQWHWRPASASNSSHSPAGRRCHLDKCHSHSRGLTLLEVILALAILAISMAAIGELIRIGSQSARDAQDLTRAQILCESKLSEIIAGAVPYDPVQRAPLLLDPDWYYTVQLEPTEEEGVLTLAVTVETQIEKPRPLAFTLVRLVVDPGVELPDVPPEEEPADLQENPTEEPPPTGQDG